MSSVSSGSSPSITIDQLDKLSKLPRHPSQTESDELCINTIRCLSIDAIQKAKSGHPGMPMGMAPAAYLLWSRHLKHNPRNPKWVNRDRFVLSAGHGCMLLYSLLHLTGYDLSFDEILNFRQWGSKTPGHPEYGHTPGVEVTTGPLGQGISNAVGMALAEKYLSAYFNRDGFPVIDYTIYVIAGDGCLMEGVSSEACSLAGTLGLNKLVVLYDDNHISIDGSTDLAFTEDSAKRYEAYGWFVQTVGGDGNDLDAIEKALIAARNENNRPSLIKLRTHIGYGSPNKHDTADAHGSPLGDDEIRLTKKQLGWDTGKKLFIPDEALAVFRKEVEKGATKEAEWNSLFAGYENAHPDLAREFKRATERKLPGNWEMIWKENVPKFDPATPLATREAQGKTLDAIMPKLPLVLGGSADLTPSNNTKFRGSTDFSKTNRLGRYIRYGVREHGMGAIMNGIAVSDMLIPYGATFFAFTDYMRPSIRLAALSKYPTIFVFTHESIGLGEDGPTHQAVEHFASLRAMPGLIILRPADANETAYAWKFALEHRDGPVVLATTRQKLPVLDQTKCASAANLSRGAYILIGEKNPHVLLLATGSEVSLAVKAYEQLSSEGIRARVVSMPSWELFEKQSGEYKESVLPPSVTARVAVEAGMKLGWERYIGQQGEFVGMTTFGMSAPVDAVFKGFGITAGAVVAAAKKVLA
ncbi:MAG: transketolase [Bacteroidetes bacterium]|nr:transketolase [Bacteroidota bacterium]MCW5896821.1 transketolase [Bacteroidota bacterium]